MAYRVEHRGVLLSSRESRTDPYVIAGSVSIESAIAERPVGNLAVRVPPGAVLAPKDFDEVTIDYPGTPYRAWAERHADLVAYWRLDEAAVTRAVDSAGNTHLDFAGGNDLQYRAYRQESAAVPYGAAPEWEHTAGAGLSGTLPAGIGRETTIAGFFRLASGASGNRHIWRAGSVARSLLLRAPQRQLQLRLDGETLSSAVDAVSFDAWHHIAVVRDASRLELWLDGGMVASAGGSVQASFSFTVGTAFTWFNREGGAAVGVVTSNSPVLSANLTVDRISTLFGLQTVSVAVVGNLAALVANNASLTLVTPHGEVTLLFADGSVSADDISWVLSNEQFTIVDQVAADDAITITVDFGSGLTPTALDGRTWQMARPVTADRVDLALDEWGIWSAALDVPALYARANSYRAFGGYVYGISDVTDAGGEDSHVLQIRLAGYGLRLDHSFVRRVYASASGSSVRAIVQDVLEEAGVDADFDSHGVELTDTVTRAVYPVESVMAILRSLADLHGAIVTVDEWREIDIVRRNAIEHSPLLLTGGRNGNVASIGRTTQPRFFASRAVVVGRGERGTIEQKATGNGVTTRFDATQPIGDAQSITEDGVEQTFTGAGARWTIDQNQQRFELAAGETPPNTAANGLIFLYTSAEALVVTADSAAAIAAIGFPIEVRYEDDSIDTTAVARVVAAARLDRHDQRFEEFVASTIPGAVRRVRPGVAPEWTFPRYGLDATRLLVEKVVSSLAPGAQFGDHNVVHRLTATALDYQGDVGDDYRTPYQPPAPRPSMGGTAADPNTTIIRPNNVAVPVQLPIRLGGEAALGILYRSQADAWHIPLGAVPARVSGHQIAVPLALAFQAQVVPRGALLAGQAVEVRLWDATTDQPLGSAVNIDSKVPVAGVLRGIALPLREFDLIYQVRVLANLRAALVWGVTLNLDIGG